MNEPNVQDKINFLNSLPEGSLQTVYKVTGGGDEFKRNTYQIAEVLDECYAVELAKNKGYYSDGDVYKNECWVVTDEENNKYIVDINMRPVFSDEKSYTCFQKQKIKQQALNKLTNEEREALGL